MLKIGIVGIVSPDAFKITVCLWKRCDDKQTASKLFRYLPMYVPALIFLSSASATVRRCHVHESSLAFTLLVTMLDSCMSQSLLAGKESKTYSRMYPLVNV